MLLQYENMPQPTSPGQDQNRSASGAGAEVRPITRPQTEPLREPPRNPARAMSGLQETDMDTPIPFSIDDIGRAVSHLLGWFVQGFVIGSGISIALKLCL